MNSTNCTWKAVINKLR